MRYLVTTIFVSTVSLLMAHSGPESIKPNPEKGLLFKQDCAQATAQVDLDINNVRARLLIGGDFAWDGNQGRYIVPKVEPGEPEVSSIFAGAIWMGGIDAAGNLKVAAQQYGTTTGESDYWPGPLTEFGQTDPQTCANWDRFFSVTSDDITLHLFQYQQARDQGIPYDTDLIPDAVKGWPAIGSEFFFEQAGFELPDASQGLAPFWDENGDGFYTPRFGDYPIIEVSGCSAPEYADEMQFWIFNDAGNMHTESMGDALQMEIQAQSFAYATADDLGNMTFNRYKTINRAQESLSDTYFGIWMDPDLGCGADDYIGCDTIRDLMYVYNSDALDGDVGAECSNGTPTYGNRIPYLGVDFMRGPLAPISLNGGPNVDTLVELGMTSFIYMNTPSTGGDTNLSDPQTAPEYYNYLRGAFKTGLPLTVGGSGIGGTVETRFAFPDEPSDPNGWSMCTAGLPNGNVKTVQAAGPFTLNPGQINELIIGIPWVPNVTYPCPDMSRLFAADDLAQSLFNTCFNTMDGPDAPDLSFISLDQKLVGTLSNREIFSNNANESYTEFDRFSPFSLPFEEALYRFEGYIVYQLADRHVTKAELDNPTKARIVFQSDRKNEAIDIFNWLPVDNPNAGPFDPPFVYIPELQVEGENEGLKTSFQLTEDLFSGAPLKNKTTYYYMAIAYGYNEHEPFDPGPTTGQPTPYIESNRNVQVYSVMPGANAEEIASYGDGAIVTRLDGKGAGSNFLSISDEERNRILEAQEDLAGYEGTILYQQGAGPIDVKTVDPINIVEGNYVLRFDQDDNLETGDTAWELFDAETEESLGRAVQSLRNRDERFFPDLGFSVTIGQTPDAGEELDDDNGAIGQAISYADPAATWLTPVLDNASSPEVLQFYDTRYLSTAPGEFSSDLDPRQAFTNLGSGHFAPYTLMDWNKRIRLYATPAWMNPTSRDVQNLNPLSNLNNVDIVFTNDKSKWSRCIVVETGNEYFTDIGFEIDDEKKNFEIVARPSVGINDDDGDGRPDPDGTGTGFAWFPGYAIDVETGTRVNIFFGENSIFGDNSVAPMALDAVNGSDMMFNPSAQAAIAPDPNFDINPYNLVLGGMHYIYVTRQPYDECAFLNETINEQLSFRRIAAFEQITWAGIGLGTPDVPLLSYAEGLIPTETLVELRVDNPYATALGNDDNASYPSYGFSIENTPPNAVFNIGENKKPLDQIELIPNPVLHTTKIVLKNGQDLENISHVEIYNASGVLQMSFENAHYSDTELDLHKLNAGIYFYKVTTRDGDQYSGKLVKMND